MFFKISISLILKLNKSFRVAFLKVFRTFYGVLIAFEAILVGLVRFWKNPEIQDGGPRWPPFKNDYVIVASCDVIRS